MSNNFAGIAAFPFRGATYRLPVRLPQGVVFPNNQVPPSVCPVLIDWNVYWQLSGNRSSVAVELNLQAASVQASILDRIASVKIDNTGSANSVYVQFDDTGDVVSCPPNCSVTFPCLTNLLNARMVVLGLTAGFIPTTRFFFYNMSLPPAVDYEISQSIQLQKASPTITRGNSILNTNFGTPALGDQLFSSEALFANVIGATTPLWNTPYAAGTFLYLTGISIRGIGVSNAASAVARIAIESTGVAGILISPFFYMQNGGVALGGASDVLTLTGMQIKLDASQLWRARVIANGDAGIYQIYSSFTQTPI